MRKIISILLLILFSFFVFAEAQESTQQLDIKIKAIVPSISLSQAFAASDGIGLYKLSGGFDFSSPGTDYILADDISKENITVYFRVDQLARTKTEETIQISVTANSLINSNAFDILSQNSEAKTETGIPTISIVSCMDISALQVTSMPKNENEVVFTLHYMGYESLENINIVIFKTTWDKTTGLAPGLYTSDVTLSYIMN